MKIAIISPIIIGIGKTITTYTSQQINLARCWANQGHQVDVITSWFAGINEALQQERIRIFLRPVWWLGGKNGIPLLMGGGWLLKKGTYDLVFASEYYQPTTALACLFSRKVVIYQGQYTAGSSWFRKLGFLILDALFLPFVKRRYYKIIAKTRKAEKFAIQKGLLRVETVPVGYDQKRFRLPTPREKAACRKLYGLSNNCGVLVYAGNLLPRRDVATAIRALAELRQQGENTRLLIAGEGPDEATLKTLSSVLGLNNHVQFLGLLSWDHLRQVYWAGDVFIFPSHYEIFGMVLVEALACGLDLVSTPCPAAVDLLGERQELGVIVPPSDPKACAQACKVLLGRRRAGQDQATAASRVLSQMTWPQVSQRIIEAVL